jgi:PhnB protein
MTKNSPVSISPSIAPWLTMSSSAKAVQFYKEAFGASEEYRIESPDGAAVIRLSIGGALFWVSDGDGHVTGPELLGGGAIRMILTLPNPDEVFDQALKAGATQIFPVGDAHGWRLGRLADPFGLHWEIGHPTEE